MAIAERETVLDDYATVHAALRDERLRMVVPAALRDAGVDWMLHHDGEVHRRLQSAFRRALTPRALQAVRPVIERLVDGLVEELRHGGTVDVVESFAFRLPIETIRHVLGTPELRPEEVHGWWRTMMTAYGSELDGPAFERVRSAAGDFRSALDEVVRERRRCPNDDVLTVLLGEGQDESLSDDELVGNAMLVIGAGFETTMALIASCILRLLGDPRRAALLRDAPDLAPSAIEEVLRLESPVVSVVRVAAQPLRFGGREVAEGCRVRLDLARANRDPDKFRDPLRFDARRSPNPHLAFGGGAHHCVGATLARHEASVAVTALVRSLPELRVVDDAVTWIDHPILHCPERLVVSVESER